MNEIIIEQTNLISNNLYRRNGGSIRCENIFAIFFTRLIIKDNFSSRNTYGIRIIDNFIQNNEEDFRNKKVISFSKLKKLNDL